MDELKEAPRLKGIPKNDPFVVPDGFFDRFPTVVQARIADHGHSNARVWFLRPVPIAGSLALLTLFLALWQSWPRSAVPLAAQEIDIHPNELPQGTWDTELLYDELGGEVFSVSTMALPDDDVLYAYLENEDLSLEVLTEEL